MCNSATHWADIGNRYRLPTCSRYCADIYRSSLFLAKTPFSWLLKPIANKIGKRKTEKCINFNKFIFTKTFKATFEQFWRRCTCLYSGRNRLLVVGPCQTCLKAASLQWGWPLWKAAHIFLTWGYCLWRYGHLMLRWRVQSCRKTEFLLHFFLEPLIQVWMKLISITCNDVNNTKSSFTYFLLIFLTRLWLVIVLTFWHHCLCIRYSNFKIAKQASRENTLQKVKSRFC